MKFLLKVRNRQFKRLDAKHEQRIAALIERHGNIFTGTEKLKFKPSPDLGGSIEPRGNELLHIIKNLAVESKYLC